MDNLTKVLCLLAAIAVCGSIVLFDEMYQADKANYEAEGKCIANLISVAIERNEIWAYDGECGVIPR